MAPHERTSIEQHLKNIIARVDERGYLVARESTTLEFKESFGFASLARYMRSMAAFANNRGGVIIFGVTNSPRKPVGVDAERFDGIEAEKITSALNEFFDPAIQWRMGMIAQGEKTFGYFHVREARDKPVICRKNHDKHLKSGEIYYRYHAQSRVIGYAELRAIIDEARERERTLWMKHMAQISRIGPRNVAFLDLVSGDVTHEELKGTFVLDEELLQKMKDHMVFVKEGVFKEKEGAPALRLIGDIIPTDKLVSPPISPELNYPYLAKEIAEALNLRPYDIHALVWKLGFKQNPKYSAKVRFGKNAATLKYSELALRTLRDLLDRSPDPNEFVAEVCREYVAHQRGHARARIQPAIID
jgi:hypothetical protein